MEPRRFFKILRARWWVVAVLAILGATAAATLARSNNSSIEPRYEAEAAIRVFKVSNERDAEYEARLEDVFEQVQTVVAPQLAANPALSIEASVESERVLLRAVSANEATAQQQARALRDAFLGAETIESDANQIRATLDILEAEIQQLRAEITALTEPTTTVDPTDQTRIDLLRAQISTLRQQVASLTLQLTYPDVFPPIGISPVTGQEPILLDEATLAGQLAVVQLALTELEEDLATSEPPTTVPVDSDLDLLVLQRQLTDLETQFVDLSVQLVTVDDSDTLADPFVPTIDRTASLQSVRTAAGIGLFGAALLAMLGLIVLDRIRRPLLSIEDIADQSPLGIVYRDRPSPNPSLPWYPQATSQRRQHVQIARARLEAAIGDEPTTILVSGVAIRRDSREFAADLASSFAAAGRRVALIDASGDTKSSLPEFEDGDAKLSRLLDVAQSPVGSENRKAAIKTALSEAMPVSVGLVSFTLGTDTLDAVDLYAGIGFRMLVEVAMAEFDLVIVAGPEITEPAAAMIAQRTSVVVLVTGLHHTTEADVARAQALLARDDTSVFVTALTGRSRINASGLSQNGGAVQRVVRKVAKSAFAVTDLFGGKFIGPRILIYHQVGMALGREMEVTQRNFVKQINWMLKRGEIVDLESAYRRLDEPGGDRLFVLTFDDGYADIFHNAFPILKKLQIPFTLYLTTGPIDNGDPLDPRYPEAMPLSWDQVRTMIASGLVTVGSHTHTHPDLRRLSTEEIERELSLADDLIEENTGVWPRHFTYPWGYWSDRAHALVQNRYESATVGAGDPVTRQTNRHIVHRFPVQHSDGSMLFQRRMVGGFRLEERIRRRIRRYTGP